MYLISAEKTNCLNWCWIACSFEHCRRFFGFEQCWRFEMLVLFILNSSESFQAINRSRNQIFDRINEAKAVEESFWTHTSTYMNSFSAMLLWARIINIFLFSFLQSNVLHSKNSDDKTKRRRHFQLILILLQFTIVGSTHTHPPPIFSRDWNVSNWFSRIGFLMQCDFNFTVIEMKIKTNS